MGIKGLKNFKAKLTAESLKNILKTKLHIIGAVISITAAVGLGIWMWFYRANNEVYQCGAVTFYPGRMLIDIAPNKANGNKKETHKCVYGKKRRWILCPLGNKSLGQMGTATTYFTFDRKHERVYLSIGSKNINRTFGAIGCAMAGGDITSTIGDGIFCIMRNVPVKCLVHN